METKYKKCILWLLLAAWMGLIFFFSAQNGDESSVASGPSSRFLLEMKYGKDYQYLPAEKLAAALEVASFSIRKLAHLSEYAVLGILWLAALRTLFVKNRGGKAYGICAILALLCSAVYAALDEWHQSFVAGRTSSLFDVAVDSTGALIGILFFLLLAGLIGLGNQKKVRRGGR